MTIDTSIIFHIPNTDFQTSSLIEQTIESIQLQDPNGVEILSLQEKNSVLIKRDILPNSKVINVTGLNHSQALNKAIRDSSGKYILYIDNRVNPVLLRQSALDIFRLMIQRNPKAGMMYSDYDLIDDDINTEIHLLKHHPGSVRDNQDYGYVFFFRKSILEEVKLFDESLITHALYDIRLKISERAQIIHIANKFDGILYQVSAGRSKVNVFDYLIAEKEVQLEAEAVVTEHLKRIDAYLSPGFGYQNRLLPREHQQLKASVIIPVNNRPEFIGTAIQSVQAQTVSEIETIIVVNGGNDDPTIKEVKRYQYGGDLYNSEKPEVQLIIVDINNIGFCLNMGIQQARGTYYVQLDSDDRLKPEAVEKIIELYNSDANIGMVIGSYEVWEKSDQGEIKRMKEIPVVTHDEWTEENGRNNLLRINGAGAPRSIPIQLIKELNYFGMNDDPFARNYGEDYDMVLHISEHYRVGRIYEPIYDVIRHSGGTDHSIDQDTINRNDEAKDWMRKEAILRRQELNA